MKLVFLGTGAAGWSRENAHLGDFRGLNRRTTSMLVDNCILIDPNSDVPEALSTFGLDPEKITTVLISHSHDDHYDAKTLSYLASTHKIDVYGDDGYRGKLPHEPNMTFHPLPLYSRLELPFGAITPVLSTHWVEDTTENCLHYILERNGQTLFYGNDGGWFGAQTWAQIRRHRYDAIVLEATFGDDPMKLPFKSYGVRFFHNTPEMLKIILAALHDTHAADEHTVIVADHLSPFYYPDIEECHRVFDPMGMIPAYDGMILDI